MLILSLSELPVGFSFVTKMSATPAGTSTSAARTSLYLYICELRGRRMQKHRKTWCESVKQSCHLYAQIAGLTVLLSSPGFQAPFELQTQLVFHFFFFNRLGNSVSHHFQNDPAEHGR